MLVFLIEIVGAKGVGGGGECGTERRKEILNGREAGEIGRGGGGYAKVHNDRNGKRV